ncbi:AEC family transporter [Saxibacter everestensis]|uniref:AEC family transporter n=1 Tax=Saxibacter everestensis TaxID=2909229 RepID=A0ABY8QR81_9MICO|nr:AEC family transporter [Brevibacteriaceae bacterium ZFBP1038]
MLGVLEGFSVIALIIVVGVVLGRTGVLGASGQKVLSRIVFYVATPALLFVTLMAADVRSVFSGALAITAGSSLFVAVLFFCVARFAWKRPAGTAIIGSWAASYVNAGNLGVPIAVYVLKDAAYVAPVMLFQLIVLAPIGMAVLDAGQQGSRWRQVLAPLRNPVTLASLAGVAVAYFQIPIPEIVFSPIDLIAGIAVPGALLAFGISLREGWKAPAKGTRRDLSLIVVLKLLVQPLVAYLLAAFVFRLEGTPLLAATLTAALPTAQNVFIMAMRYSKGINLARDSALLTTFLSVPVIIMIVALLA